MVFWFAGFGGEGRGGDKKGYFSWFSGVFVFAGMYGRMWRVVFGLYTFPCLAISITSCFVGGFLRNR